MKSVICTLFERHYHCGLVGLVNSLHANGYKGDIYAGYLGKLPAWAKISTTSRFEDQVIETFVVDDSVSIHFVPLTTTNHLTNYKPNFMKWLWDGPVKDAENLFYFDPDIIISYKWEFFEEWAGFGVGVCEDVNSPLTVNHPRKVAWHKYFESFKIPLNFNQPEYANGGFVGLNKKDAGFIDLWIKIQESIAPLIGGLQWSSISGKRFSSEEHLAEYFPFKIPDQDALNIAIGAWDGIVSFVGKEGMAFKQGPVLMYHALGNPKPWKIKFLRRSLIGFRPRKADKIYWEYASHPIKLYSGVYTSWKKFTSDIASFIGRFYGKY